MLQLIVVIKAISQIQTNIANMCVLQIRLENSSN